MRVLGSFLVIILFSACGEEPASEHSEKLVEAQKVLAVAPAKKTAVDTTPVNRNYIIDRARPKDQINATYPYDIPLKTATGELTNSAAILAKDDRPIVLLFWLTTCYPCRLEMKAIAGGYEKWQEEQPFHLVAISTDFQKNFPSFSKMVAKNKWPWKSYNDVNREFRQLMPGKLNGLPQLFVLDKDRKITYHKRKYEPGDENELFRQIQLAAVGE